MDAKEARYHVEREHSYLMGAVLQSYTNLDSVRINDKISTAVRGPRI